MPNIYLATTALFSCVLVCARSSALPELFSSVQTLVKLAAAFLSQFKDAPYGYAITLCRLSLPTESQKTLTYILPFLVISFTKVTWLTV